jgi:hypothetical protein
LSTHGRERRRHHRVVLKLIAAAVGVAVFIAVIFVFALWLWWLPDPDDDQRSRGINGLWAAHTWVGDEHSDADYRDLADLLEGNGISDVFFHAGPLEADGSVPADLTEHASDLLAAMRRYASDVRTQAYLGQIEARDGGPLDLDDPRVRDGIVATAERFLDLGFRGIHYDIEPIFPGDESFLDLLDRTRALTQARGAVLSVALEQAAAVPNTGRLIRLFVPGYHNPSTAFLEDVAARVDQVAIMTYDSGLPVDWLFGAHMAWQTEWVVDAIGEEVTVFMGIPTYEEGSAGKFFSWAENINSGVRGVRKGLDRLPDSETRDVGIAIFAEWTTTDDEWDAYASSWLED